MFQAFPNILVEPPVLGPICVWNGSNFQGAPAYSVVQPTPLVVYFERGPSIDPPFPPQPGAVLGTVGKSSGKHYFEVALTAMFWLAGANSVPLTTFISAVGISQAINTVSPYRFGASGQGCVYDNLGTLTDADTFGTIPNFAPAYQIVPAQPAEPIPTPPVFQNIGWAVDFGALKVWPRGPDGTFYGGDPATGTGGQSIAAGTYYPCVGVNSAEGVAWGGIAVGYFNNGQFSLGPVPGGFSQWR